MAISISSAPRSRSVRQLPHFPCPAPPRGPDRRCRPRLVRHPCRPSPTRERDTRLSSPTSSPPPCGSVSGRRNRPAWMSRRCADCASNFTPPRSPLSPILHRCGLAQTVRRFMHGAPPRRNSRSWWDHEFESPLLQQAVCLSGERRDCTGKAPHFGGILRVAGDVRRDVQTSNRAFFALSLWRALMQSHLQQVLTLSQNDTRPRWGRGLGHICAELRFSLRAVCAAPSSPAADRVRSAGSR